jgi:hypothetical protein
MRNEAARFRANNRPLLPYPNAGGRTNVIVKSCPQLCAMSTRGSQERRVRNCLTDEGRPLGVGLQERASNRLSAAMDKSHGRERERKRLSEDWVRCQARRGLQGNHY